MSEQVWRAGLFLWPSLRLWLSLWLPLWLSLCEFFWNTRNLFLKHHTKTLAKFGDTVKENPFLFGAALVLLAVAVAVAVAFAGAVRCRHVHQFGHVRELTPEAGKL